MGVDVILLQPGVTDWATLDIEPISIVLARHGLPIAPPDDGTEVDLSRIVETTWERAKAADPDLVSADLALERNWLICEDASFLIHKAELVSLHFWRLMDREFYKPLLFDLIHGLGLVMTVDGGDLAARADVLAALPPACLYGTNPDLRHVVETIGDC
ncbi:hypothetical protein NFI95_11275 [Acetobacteraceae bacterium KSS8]|uniref:Uncharacterized protein n=1 Tax=Endosaccharibacter trunci TaxID=2812733 RepID=A0ABT1W817_9PROT|nr:hypothetical protein [Acetobacteraceae bacterium KSS8]